MNDNEIIAHFMGAERQTWYNESKMYQQSGIYYAYPTSGEFPDNSRYHSADMLKYHSKWDWIIPVIRKWDNLNVKSEEYYGLSNDLDDMVVKNYDINDVYPQLVKNIKCYNTWTL